VPSMVGHLVCTQRAQCMHVDTCAQCMHTACTQRAHSVHTACTQRAHSVHTWFPILPTTYLPTYLPTYPPTPGARL